MSMLDHEQERATALARLAALSARLGADRDLIQGAGGNTSLKHNGRELWVKASGTWLSAAERQPIFVGLDLPEVLRRLAAGEAEPAMPARLDPGSTLRPSIETTLHALLPHRVVVHVHSVNAIAHAVRADGAAMAATRLEGLRWAWVPYAKPGLPLTCAVQAVLQEKPDILLLGNHGLVIGAESPDTAEALLREVERRLAMPARSVPAPDLVALERIASSSGGRYRPAQLAEAHRAATDPALARIASRGSLYPDHVVFLGPAPVPVMTAAEAALWLKDGAREKAASLLLIEGAGAMLRIDMGAGAEEMAACLGLVLPRLDPTAPLVFLSPDQEDELLDWDAEKYRQSLNMTAE